jgi:hypothetical protein
MKRAAALAAGATRDGIEAQSLSVADAASSPRRADVLVCASRDAALARIATETRAPLVVSAWAGDRAHDAGAIEWRRVRSASDLPWETPPTRTDVVVRQVQALTAAATLPPLAELVDDCSKIAYHQTAVRAPFVALAVGSLAAAACLRARPDASASDERHLDLLGPPFVADGPRASGDRVSSSAPGLTCGISASR